MYIELFCDVCNAVKYRSTRAFSKDNLPGPADFRPLNPEHPIITTDGPPVCPDCTGRMIPRPAEETELPDSSMVERPAVNRKVGGPNPPSGAIQTLFQAEPDEMIHTVKDGTNAVTIITTRRVIRVTT